MLGYILLAAAVIGIVFLLIGRVQDTMHDRHRLQSLRDFAASHGYSFDPVATKAFDYPFADYEILNHCRTRLAENLIKGRIENIEFVMFDFHCALGFGRQRSIDERQVVALHLPVADLPAFQLTKESWFDKTRSLFGYQDIDFSTYPAFSKCFLLQGENESAVRELFNADVIEFFQQHSDTFAEAHGDWLLIHRTNLIRPEHLNSFLATASQIGLQLIPA